jgi:hypothetical protein
MARTPLDPETFYPEHPRRAHSDGDAYWDAVASLAAAYAEVGAHRGEDNIAAIEVMRECVADLIEVASGYDFVHEILAARRAKRAKGGP